MHTLATVPMAQVDLRWDRPLPGSVHARTRQLRGALASAFCDDDLFHQHDPATGKPIYRYPRVHYRWRQGNGQIIGIGEAAQRLLTLPWLDLGLWLGNDAVIIADAELTCRQGEFGISDRLLRYHFHSPVLLFNQSNYRSYQALSAEAQQAERDRLLTASLLSALRGLDIHFPQRLYATFVDARLRPSRYKGETFLGVKGEFITNARLPDNMAIGHAVSHGFGVLGGASNK